MKLKKLVIQALLLTIGMGYFSASTAGYAQQVEIRSLFVASGYAVFSKLGTGPNDTCSYFGRYWRFDVTTPQGEALLKVLLSAQATKSIISVWYHNSSAPGKDHTNGCTYDTMAVPYGIGFYGA